VSSRQEFPFGQGLVLDAGRAASGFTGHEIAREDVVPIGATILRKPVEFDELLELLPKD
jgi:hypothetical protein